jgi:hypothetical protein
MRFLPLCRPLMDRLVRRSRLFLAASVGLPVLAASEWPAYLGDAGATHYSTVSELTPGNVAQLRPVICGETRPRTSAIR